jgi:hypothetical protein
MSSWHNVGCGRCDAFAKTSTNDRQLRYGELIRAAAAERIATGSVEAGGIPGRTVDALPKRTTSFGIDGLTVFVAKKQKSCYKFLFGGLTLRPETPRWDMQKKVDLSLSRVPAATDFLFESAVTH